jgi:cytoskeletal protein RodZ
MNEEKNQPVVPNFEGETMKMPENNDLPESDTNESSSIINAPLLFTLAVLLVLILAGMFYWFNVVSQNAETPTTTVERPTPEENNEPESTTAEAQVETMQAVSTSDEISAIESDIEGTMLDNIANELNAIDAEIEAALE